MISLVYGTSCRIESPNLVFFSLYMEMDSMEISNQLSCISLEHAVKEWDRIAAMSDQELHGLNGRSRVGCKLLDRYFFHDRLTTKGNKGINFFDFIRDFDDIYSKKKYISTLISFCKREGRYRDSPYGRLWYCYGLCFGRITPFKITNAVALYRRFTPSHVLDPFAGFGGRMVAAMMEGVEYTGFDTNIDLREGYRRLMTDFVSHGPPPVIRFEDSTTVDYTGLTYDMVLSSPPYENVEQYNHQPYRKREEWDIFYRDVFAKTWMGLSPGGVYAINISPDIFSRIMEPMFGEPMDRIILKKSSRNNYTEMIYIWKKNE